MANRPYIMYTGMDGMELWESTVAHQFKSTEATKKRLDAIHAKITTGVEERSCQVSNDIIKKYGVVVHEICKKMVKGKPFSGSTIYMELHGYVEHPEEDEEYILSFNQGIFFVYKIVSGGYGGTTTVETNVYIGRVQHLIDTYGK